MNNIVNKQNELQSIQMLGAQNSIYRTAKQYSVVKFYICVVSVIILTYSNLFIAGLSSEIAYYSILVFMLGFLLDSKISTLKTNAAKIQNKFDLYLYSIKWDNIIFGKEPEYDIIPKEYAKYVKKYKNQNKLQNWYEVAIDTVPFGVAKLICQKTNCRYDHSLRKKLHKCINFAFVIPAVLILITIFHIQLDFKSIIIQTLPLLPIIQWGCSNISNQKNALKKNIELNEHINDAWNIVLQGESVDDSYIVKIQSQLYQYRCISPLIPEWFYNKYRDDNEKRITYSVDSLIKEYKREQP